MNARALYLGTGSRKRVAHTQEALVVTNAEGQTIALLTTSPPNANWLNSWKAGNPPTAQPCPYTWVPCCAWQTAPPACEHTHMSLRTPASWLVTYDISDKKRLTHIHNALKKEGIPVQYSVFHLLTSQAKMGTVMVKLARLSHPQADDIRAYRIPANPWQATLGQPIIPTDVWQDPGNPFLLR